MLLVFSVLRLFELQSDFKKMFKRMMTQTETGEYDFDWNKLGNHANIVMNALDNAVDGMGDSSYLSKGLLELGERHKMYSVKPEMVPVSTKMYSVKPEMVPVSTQMYSVKPQMVLVSTKMYNDNEPETVPVVSSPRWCR